MEKIRVYELAKELKMTSKELVAKLKDLDVGIKSHMSILSGETLETVKIYLMRREKSRIV